MLDNDLYALLQSRSEHEWIMKQEPVDHTAETREEREMREDEW